MTYKRKSVHYVKRRLAGVGLLDKSLGTKNARRAAALEEMVLQLHSRGRIDLICAFKDGSLKIQELADAYERDALAELTIRLTTPNPALEAAIREALQAKRAHVKPTTLERYGEGLAHFYLFALENGVRSVREALTTKQLERFKLGRSRHAAQQTVNKDLAAVSVLATYALREGWIDERPKIVKFPYKRRIRYLDSAQVTLYMAHLRPQFRPLMGLLIATGCRLGEAERLKAGDLRFHGGGARALIEDAKTPEGIRAVFVPSWSAEELVGLVEAGALSASDRLFRIPRRTVQKEHERACAQAGIPSYTIHDHRHTAAVHLAMARMPIERLAEQLGHTDIRMTREYMRFNPDYGEVAPFFEAAAESLGMRPRLEKAATPPEGT